MEHVDEILEALDSPVVREMLEQKFKFVHPYKHTDGSQQTASVFLHVDLVTKQFKVLPGDGRDGFSFVSGSHRHAMWKATTKCMEAAIDFAVETLNLNSDEQSI